MFGLLIGHLSPQATCQHLKIRVIRVIVVSLRTFCLFNADVDKGRSNQGLQVVALPDTERDLGWFGAVFADKTS